MINITPTLHRILIKPDTLEEKTDSGIIIKYDKREEAAVETGTVIKIGSTAFKEFGTTAADEGVKEGSRISFAKYSGKTIHKDDVRYLIINDEDIVGVYND